MLRNGSCVVESLLLFLLESNFFLFSMNVLSGKSILVTGGTGSFGKKFVATIASQYESVRRIVIFSRDELKQFEMAQEFPKDIFPQIEFVLGDIRDKESIRKACIGIDIVVHAAALKQVPAAEKNPFEFVKTNILGTQNLIEIAIENRLSHFIALSTDKAVLPESLYGATKMCMERLLMAAHQLYGQPTKFVVARQGNFMDSRGSVVPLFLDKRKKGKIPITDERMTRFNMTLQESVNMVLFALEHALGGEIFIPKTPSYRLIDLAKAIAPESEIEIIGKRMGEKIHECLMSETETDFAIENTHYYILVPEISTYLKHYQAKRVEKSRVYSSDNNRVWLSIEQLQAMIHN